MARFRNLVFDDMDLTLISDGEVFDE